jgi:hypothetical protein
VVRVARLQKVAGDEPARSRRERSDSSGDSAPLDIGVTQQAYIKTAGKAKAEGMAKLPAALKAAQAKVRKAK